MTAEYAHRPRAASSVNTLANEACRFQLRPTIVEFFEPARWAIDTRALAKDGRTLARVSPCPDLGQVVDTFEVAVGVYDSLVTDPVPREDHVEIAP